MATIKEIADIYSNRLLSTNDGVGESRKIAAEIQQLKYEGGRALTEDDKKAIIKELNDVKRGPNGLILKEADNKNYLKLVALIQTLVAK